MNSTGCGGSATRRNIPTSTARRRVSTTSIKPFPQQERSLIVQLDSLN
ncbi:MULTISPECIES: hypothetical protein [Cryobacterium]|nr:MULTISPECIES: hypothetical protein [Cryobacterium]